MLSQEQRREALRKQVKADEGGFPGVWKPEPDDVLEGEVTDRRPYKGNAQLPPCDVLVIQDAATGEEQTVFMGSVVLVRLLKRHDPQPGDYVLLRYVGLAADDKTKLYALAVDKRPAPPQTAAEREGPIKKDAADQPPLTPEEREAVGF